MRIDDHRRVTGSLAVEDLQRFAGAQPQHARNVMGLLRGELDLVARAQRDRKV